MVTFGHHVPTKYTALARIFKFQTRVKCLLQTVLGLGRGRTETLRPQNHRRRAGAHEGSKGHKHQLCLDQPPCIASVESASTGGEPLFKSWINEWQYFSASFIPEVMQAARQNFEFFPIEFEYLFRSCETLRDATRGEVIIKRGVSTPHIGQTRDP